VELGWARMPDYQPSAGMATRRPQRGSDDEATRSRTIRAELEPAPEPWTGLPYIAVLLMLGFLAVQLYPATHWRHPQDRYKRWIPHTDPKVVQATGQDAFYSTLDEVQVQQTDDLASQEDLAALPKASFSPPPPIPSILFLFLSASDTT
jgi:hypothetical protein